VTEENGENSAETSPVIGTRGFSDQPAAAACGSTSTTTACRDVQTSTSTPKKR